MINKNYDYYAAIDFTYDNKWLPQDKRVLNIWFDRVVGIEFDYKNVFRFITEDERECTIKSYMQNKDVRLWSKEGYAKIEKGNMLLIGFYKGEEHIFNYIENSTEFHNWILNQLSLLE